MKRGKLIIIGIDSLEPSFVNKLIEHGVSRGFAQFREAGIIRHLKSTFPPDTLLTWPTIYTGLLPYRFGLKPEPEDIHTLREESIKIRQKLIGKTFWDILSRKGKKVLVINPIFGYPPWKVNGFMVSGPCFGLRGKPLSQPPLEYISKYRLGTYGKTPLLPHEYKLVWNEALEQLISVFELTYKMVSEDVYDIVFFADYTLDRIQHYYWDFEVGNSASRYIWGDELRNTITNYYRLLDSMINWLIKKMGDEYTFIVLGDHGHKERPHTLIALDDILNGTRKTFSFKDVTKHILYMFLYYSGLGNISYYFVKKLQEKNLLGRLIKKKTGSNSNERMIETLWEFGLKEYVGIKVRGNKDNYSKNEILSKVSRILIEKGLAEFVSSPSQYYELPEPVNVDADLYIKLMDGLGNMQSEGSFKYIPNYTRGIIPGGHAMYSLFMIYSTRASYKVFTPIVRVQDVAPSILSIMDIRTDEEHFDGIRVVENV